MSNNTVGPINDGPAAAAPFWNGSTTGTVCATTLVDATVLACQKAAWTFPWAWALVPGAPEDSYSDADAQKAMGMYDGKRITLTTGAKAADALQAGFASSCYVNMPGSSKDRFVQNAQDALDDSKTHTSLEWACFDGRLTGGTLTQQAKLSSTKPKHENAASRSGAAKIVAVVGAVALALCVL